jgi:hypothetical protein
MVEELIRRARRRLILNEALSQFARACAFAMGGLALILLTGTRFLEWWTLTLFAAAGVAWGAALVWRAVPDVYAAAVRVDETARLHDSLSTAIYFSQHESSCAEFQKIQRSQAEEAARGVNLASAVPYTFPKALYAMAALTLLASGLVAFRFASTKGLDLRAPITEVLFEDLAARPGDKAHPSLDAAQRKRLDDAESLLAKLGVPIKPEDKKDEAALDQAIEQALEGGQTPGEKGQKGPNGAGDGKPAGGLQQQPNGDPLDGRDENAENADKGNGGRDEQGDKGEKKSSNGESGSLFSKLKDAVNNLFSKANKENTMGAQKGSDQKNQMAKADKGGEKGQNSKGDQQQGNSDAQSEDDATPGGDAQQQGEQAEGKAGSKSSQQSAQAGSGAGSQDGAKDVKAANDLKAMGKLSEIIGKRSATVTGETTIEVQSGNQQLKTAYSNQTSAHGEADSDVSRDEIPVALQPYVRQYFEQVRKAGQAAGAKTKQSAPAQP